MDGIELVESDELDSLYCPSFEGGDEGLSASRVMIHQIDPLLKMLWRFDAVQDVRELTSLLRRC